MITTTQKWIIAGISVAIPLVVVLLFFVKISGYETTFTFLPPLYATINGITAITLVLAVKSIRSGNRSRHENLMKLSIALSLVFLVCYILYHITTPTTYFGDTDHNGVLSAEEKEATGSIRLIYFLILASHILLSIAIIPMVLISYVYTLSQKFDRHRRIARITFPIWLYVAITGVIVYMLISPYYAH